MACILVIDDDDAVRKTVSRILMRSHHVAIEADNGRSGLRRLVEDRPGIMITDIVMPEQEGIETILEARRLVPGIKIIAMSGGDNGLYLKAAAKLGADAVLAKPFRPAELTSLVERLLTA